MMVVRIWMCVRVSRRLSAGCGSVLMVNVAGAALVVAGPDGVMARCCDVLRHNVWTTSGFVLAASGGSRCFYCKSCCSAVVRCGEEDETVVARKFASDKGGGCHGDGKR